MDRESVTARIWTTTIPNCGAVPCLRLRGLLESDKPMQPSEQHLLQDHSSATFLLMCLRKLVLDDQDKTESYSVLYLNSVYPRTSKLDWLRLPSSLR